MGLLDKMKNLFTEEVEEEPVLKKEVRHIEVEAPTRSERIERETKYEDDFDYNEVKEEPKEEKFVFFSDEDFDELDKLDKPTFYRNQESKKEEVKEEKPVYQGKTNEIEEKKSFKPSPIISPVYGVLDKNYSSNEIVTKKIPTRIYSNPSKVSVDDVRNKAYGTIEDELKDALLGKTTTVEEVKESDIDIFEELEKYDDSETVVPENKEVIDVDDLFDSLDIKKEEILDELDNRKEEILDELDNKKSDIIIDDDISLDDLDLDDETLELSKQLEDQKRKLEEINDYMPEEDKESENEDIELEDNLNESELFDLIDSMYEKKDDE